ncbi:MAG: folylpolyglutamate synthase/dihydrofolate synthase family protein [bacterium]|nr:folylpolyglutamate synthase/dihydrofolate synthase family protein [bacterium]
MNSKLISPYKVGAKLKTRRLARPSRPGSGCPELETHYSAAVDFIESRQLFGIQLGLSNITELLSRLGHPEKDLRFIHIAGTNGKGSVAAYLGAALSEAGCKVGVYTSPHLIDIRERMTIRGKPISEDRFCQLVDRIKPVVERMSNEPTYFEVGTALVLLYFALEKVDLAVMETGLGGRLDATNVIKPEVSIITNVDLDHTDRLGSSLAEITREKAGIIKKGVPVLTAEEKAEVINILQETASQRGSPLYRLGQDISYQIEEASWSGTKFNLKGLRGNYRDLFIPLAGEYQVKNAALAVGAYELLGFPADHLKKGLSGTSWPGRLQVVSHNPFIILDGAHNPAAVRELRYNLKKLFCFDRLFIILGILGDKDIEGIIRELIQLSPDTILLVEPPCSRAAAMPEIAKILERYTDCFELVGQIDKALKDACQRAEANDLVCVTGSLYTVAEAYRFRISDFGMRIAE